MARILCDQLTKRYGNVAAVDRLDLEIENTEFMVLLGPSGCGKTTTLNMIAGLEEPSDGNLFFDDEVVNFMPPHLREVAMVFQSYALYPQKSVYDNIAFGLKLRRTPQAEIDRLVRDAAEQLEIGHLLDRRPSQLSGGQRQRVALGRALVRKPRVFLMDEPLSNLDASLRITMRTLIKKLHQTMATTFVYVTHDQAEAMTLADRIAVMRDGLLQQLAGPREIYQRPRNMFVAAFLGSPRMNFIEGKLEVAKGRTLFRRGSLAIAVDGVPGAAASIGREVVLGVRPEDIEVVRDSDDSLESKVLLVSPLGAEQHLDLMLGDVELIARADKELEIAPGAVLPLHMAPRRIHLFDRATEESLALEVAA
jgi:multiple sugar transport system ATP-binding protein